MAEFITGMNGVFGKVRLLDLKLNNGKRYLL